MSNARDSSAAEAPASSPSLTEELNHLLDRVEETLHTARKAYRQKKLQELRQPTPTKSRLGRFLLRSPPPSSTNKNPSTPPRSGNSNVSHDEPEKPPAAQFLPLPIPHQEDQLIEDLRRIAELAIIGENTVTTAQKKQDRKDRRERHQWVAERDGDLEAAAEAQQQQVTSPTLEESGIDLEDHAQLFDLFFERNALELIVNLLLGNLFDLNKYHEEDCRAAAEQTAEQRTAAKNKNNKDDAEANDDPILETGTLLPSLAIATQAVQSISILIQNVSRATSLYVILSNNHINTLVGLPLDLYTQAERYRVLQGTSGSSSAASSPTRTFASPPMTELTTHFVTFLKSLALRMTAETLQFFLKYPTSSIDNKEDYLDGEDKDRSHNNMDEMAAPTVVDPTVEELRSIPVEFPLYERALEFCAAHQDSFVRVTAMNICLNTLRLTTVAPPENDDDGDHQGRDNSESSANGKTGAAAPNGVLHTAKALPFRERFAIAQFACIPSRVERLIAPIFTKLAERWNRLGEQIQEIDSNKAMALSGQLDVRGAQNEKVAKVKEKVRRERLTRAFNDRAADLQDEMLLLDDVFQVGLTVLNEQTIEMMLATFVYPLLLQPLLLYYKRLTPALEEAKLHFSDHPFRGYSGDVKRVEEMVAPAAGPAKTALFSLACAFHVLSNRPLCRLLFTALFHPLSPDSTSVPTVRSAMEVSTLDAMGRQTIRLDESHSEGDLVPDERTTYSFGTDPLNRRRSKSNLSNLTCNGEESEACVFVLAPALAEVLEFRGDDFGLMTRAKANPYRQALLQCLQVPDDFSDVRTLAVCLFDAALKSFGGNFASDILLGADLKKYDDDMPLDERNLDSEYAHMENDRGLGGGVSYESRTSLGKSQSVGSDVVGEVVSSLASCVVYASPLEDSDEWDIGYDEFATHALFCSIRRSPQAILLASKAIENRWRQAASLVTARASSIISPMGGSAIRIRGSPSVNDPRYDEKVFNAVLDILVYGSLEHQENAAALEDLLLPLDTEHVVSDSYSTAISAESTFKDLCSQIGSFFFVSRTSEKDVLKRKRDGFTCLFKLDALLTILRDLAATGGLAIRDAKLTGSIVSRDGSWLEFETFNMAISRRLYGVLSVRAADTFFNTEKQLVQPGSRVHLVGCPALACVCEAPASLAALLSEAGSGVVAEGISWQSLYLVIHEGSLIFAQPLQGEMGGDGRVISACPLERVWVETDSMPDAASPARRLLLSHSSFEMEPPSLFLFDTVPEPEKDGPFFKVKPKTSRLDVWFEDQRAADNAFSCLSGEIFQAKSQRGQRLQEFLSLVS